MTQRKKQVDKIALLMLLLLYWMNAIKIISWLSYRH
jgi:hypothetical protein